MKKCFLAATAAALFATGALAEVKVGMITTLSGGGAGLGIDVRDGFMLAIAQSGRDDIEVVIEDDQRKPDIAVQLSDKMIQSERVDVMTGIIWSNLAMAVVPAAVKPKCVLSVTKRWTFCACGSGLSPKLLQCCLAERQLA